MLYCLKNNQRGMGLMEVMIGMAIMFIISPAILASFFSGTSAYKYTLSQSGNITSARNILNTVAEEVRYATTVSIINGSTEIDYTLENNQTRKIYKDKNSIIIEHDGKQYKKIATGITQEILFTQDGTTRNKITVQIKLNDNSYAKSPDLAINNMSIVLPNMKKD